MRSGLLRPQRWITNQKNNAAHPGGASICGSVEIPFHIVQGAAVIQIIRARPNISVDALGLQFRLEGFSALLAEKGLATVILGALALFGVSSHAWKPGSPVLQNAYSKNVHS